MRGIPVSSLVLLMLSFLCVHNVEAQSTNGTVPIAAILNDPVPLGLESYAIPDSSMTASTEYSANHGARSARSSNANQWIQMDLLDRYKIISVATQGRQDSDQWVQSYKLACSTDGTTFHTVQGISTNPGADRIFTGNSDRNTIVTNTLPVPQFCRYIRLMPVSWYGQISLRMQIFREDINECSPDPCENGGRCSDGVDSFTCACAPGYTGPTCGTDNNECSPDPCENGGRCSDGVDSFTCACAPGYTGPTCVTDINECSPDPCENGGTCSDGMNTFTCACAPGYTGPTCLTDINDCSPDPCENGGTCSDGVNTFTCACAPGYTGTTCKTAILNDPRPLGLESYVIPDSSMTASSEESADHGAKRGRLNVRKVKTLRGAWSARSNNANQWIQVDLLDLYRINSVATQGRQAYNQWVTSYKLACSTDGTTFNTVQGISTNPGADRIFTGNSDRNTIVTNTLPVPQICRYVRLMPVRWFGHISLRMEIYGEGPITDINDCSPDPCENGGTCIDGVDTFTCACAPGYIGPMCRTAARVTCDSSSMTVFISKTLNILPADLHFIDESCVGYNHNGENIALYSRYDKCKFTTEENSDFIIYSNVISTTVTDNTPNGSVITRVMGETLINVRCQIRRRQVLSRFYNPISSSLKIDEVGYGNFTVDFERYTDENFRERHPNEAAPVRIQDRLFYAVSLTSVSNLTLFIDHCWSTPSSDPLDTKQYDLIKDGCASDDTVQTISTFGPSFKPFAFDAFTFIGDYSQVYVHCEVVACNEGDTNSICAQGCLAPVLPVPARRRRNVMGGTNSQPRIVSQIVGPFVKGSEKQGVTAKTGWASPYILLASLAAGACLFIGMIAMYAVMKARM